MSDQTKIKPVAVVDIGSTSTRLLLDTGADQTRSELVTGLGVGLVDGGDLPAAGLANVGEALGHFAAAMQTVGIDPSEAVVVSTAAARRARSSQPLAQLVHSVLGAELEVLDAEAEGHLTFAGATSGRANDGLTIVLDIGGGSTELTVGSANDGVLGSFSADIGATRVIEQFFETDPPRPSELSAALSVIELHMVDVAREVPAIAAAFESGAPLIGVGGTVTTAAAVEVGLQTWDASVIDGFDLERAAAEDVFRTLVTEAAVDRAYNPGLPADQVETILGGMCILVSVYRYFGAPTISVSIKDLMDGVLQRCRH